ncbi:MAG: stage 0 sporulation family protein [Thiohalospira sp.]
MESKDKQDNIPVTNISQCGCMHPENCSKLETFDWLSSIPEVKKEIDIVEVRFKNTRKEFFVNSNGLRLRKGDIVAVEASPGHDIGIVSLTGELVYLQLKKQGISPEGHEFKKIYRKAKAADLEKWYEAVMLEHTTMIKTRKIAAELKLDMKIGDVEYQGDRTKAIFYYIADERVDFRELIKILADTFKIRIEMRQIGARQEAGRIGGIGSCGRELCCSTWITNFVSVTTNAARYQEISLNPQKLAGQCGKLKCCLNYELDCYIDAQKDFPSTEIVLETEKGQAYHNKTDIFRRIMWYSFDRDSLVNITPVPIDRVIEIIELNKKGKKVDALIDLTVLEEGVLDYKNVVGQESLTRFDDKKGKRRKRKSNKSGNNRRKRPKNDKNQKK